MRFSGLPPIALLCLTELGCGAQPSAPTPGPPAAIRAEAGNNQTVDPRTSQRLTTRVTDALGTPVPGIAISWDLLTGTGTLEPRTGTTDIGGKTSTTLFLTTKPSNREVRAAVVADSTLRVTFTVLVTGPSGAEEPDVVIAVGDNFFRPNSVSAGVGQLVEWRWIGTTLHNLVFDDTTLCVSPRGTRPCRFSVDGTWRHRFQQAGTFAYRCTLHLEQRGTIIAH